MARHSFFKNWFLRRTKLSIELKLAEKVFLMTIYITLFFWNFLAKIWCQLSISYFFQLLTSLLPTSFILSRFQMKKNPKCILLVVAHFYISRVNGDELYLINTCILSRRPDPPKVEKLAFLSSSVKTEVVRFSVTV